MRGPLPRAWILHALEIPSKIDIVVEFYACTQNAQG
jgi:hypothetical protein